MVSVPETAVGKMIRAVARRDNDSFKRWRAEVNKDEAWPEIIFPLLYEVFRSAVELRFGSLEHAGQIDAFIDRRRLPLWPDVDLSQDQAKSLMRSALGERGVLGDLSTEVVVIMRLQLVTHLVEEMSLTDEQLDWLIGESERWVAEHPE